MTEYSYFWKGTDGDAAMNPYSAHDFSEYIRKIFEADRSAANVLKGYASSLVVTNPSALTIRVASGAALVDGKLYINDSDIDFPLSTPGSGTDYYLVVLRKNFSLHTVTVGLLSNNGSAPAVTQTDGVMWEVELARFTLTSAGVMSTITDSRRTLAANRYKSILHRNSQATKRQKVQLGVIRWTGSASSGNVTVTFQYPYDETPTVICTHQGAFFVNCVVQPSQTKVVIYWKDVDGTTRSAVDIAWMAVGAMERN